MTTSQISRKAARGPRAGWGALSLTVALSVTALPTARADEPDPRAEHARAEALFNQGRPAEAAAIWEALLVQVGPDKAWRANYNLGLSYAAIGQPTLAVERFDAFVTRIQALATVPDELAVLDEDARARVAAIRASHGRIELAAAPGVKVRIDGGELRDVGFTAFVTPGRHTVEVVADDGSVRAHAIEVAAGRAIAVSTAPLAPPAPTPPSPLPPPPVLIVEEPPTFPTVWVLVGVGLTAASFALPGALFARASDARDRADALGPGHTTYGEARDTFEDRRLAYELSYLLPAGLGLLTGVVAVVGAARVAAWSPTPGTELGVGPRSGGASCWLGGSF